MKHVKAAVGVVQISSRLCKDNVAAETTGRADLKTKWTNTEHRKSRSVLSARFSVLIRGCAVFAKSTFFVVFSTYPHHLPHTSDYQRVKQLIFVFRNLFRVRSIDHIPE